MNENWGPAPLSLGFLGGSGGGLKKKKKNPSANAGAIRDAGSISGSEDPLEEGTATHSSIFVWKISMDRRACQATILGVAKNQT